jgi:hypothetical protein
MSASKLVLTRPSLHMKPEPHKLNRTDDYEAMSASLSENAKSALRLVEEGIADDPDHRVARYQYPASRIVVDYSADDLAVSYYVLANGTVVLLDVQESRRSP